MKRRVIQLIAVSILILAFAPGAYFISTNSTPENEGHQFSGERSYQDVAYQVSLGPRTSGSLAHTKIIEWIIAELEQAGWQAEIQATEMMGHPIQNILATRSDERPQILMAAHYDTRIVADQDPDPAKRTESVPGANDGASGVAVLLELARTLPHHTVPTGLLFTDAEDNGKIQGWDWILGARAYVLTMVDKPQAVIIIDMIGDTDLNIYMERNSDLALTKAIWAQAAELGYQDIFIDTPKYRMVDDHLPFIEAGLPSIDIIDFDYPFWHTTTDTIDKVSPESLQAVGETLWTWIVSQP